jgi:hypothetical protein
VRGAGSGLHGKEGSSLLLGSCMGSMQVRVGEGRGGGVGGTSGCSGVH